LANHVGLDRTYIGGTALTSRNHSLVNIVLIAAALGIPVRKLFETANEKE
jgi:hypothetical protein